jgi:hypothetical protein
MPLPETAMESEVKARILFAVEIASKNDYAISTNEIAQLLPDICEVNVGDIIKGDRQLLELLSVKNDLLVMKGYEKLFAERLSRRENSQMFLRKVKTFSDELIRRCPYVKLLAVCGSVAYNSAAKTDDIDFFLITKKNRLWISIFKILLLARAYNLKEFVNGKQVTFCLSYSKDEKSFEDEMVNHKTPLFARELLSVHVVEGLTFYQSMLTRLDWIQSMFPRLYVSKLRESEQTKNQKSHTGKENAGRVRSILNLGIYSVIRYYLLFRAFLLNLKYRKQNKMRDMFEAVMSIGSSIYMSQKYRELEEKYNHFSNQKDAIALNSEC